MIHLKSLPQSVLCALVLAVSVLSVPLLAQESEMPTVSVANVSGDIAHEVVIPVEVSGLEGVIRMELEIQYPPNILNFLEVRSPMSEDGTVASADPEVVDSPDGFSVLSIEVDSTQPIGAGTVVEMVFDPSDEIFENQFFLVSILKASLETA
ncbi:MAG: hypothetical protein V3R94_10480, partial [Acidobacteriota bacterium]